MNNLIRMARSVVLEVPPLDGGPRSLFVPLNVGQVVRAGAATKDGYRVGVGGAGEGVVLEEEYEEEDESVYLWMQTQFSAN